MSRAERWGGRRELTYSHFHRAESMGRFLPPYQADQLGMIDLDDVEWCNFCRQPIALLEATRYTGHFEKVAHVTTHLSRLASVPAYIVYYDAPRPNVCTCCHLYVPPWPDPTAFWVDGPLPRPFDQPLALAPDEYARWLVELRLAHADECGATTGWKVKNWRLWRAGLSA